MMNCTRCGSTFTTDDGLCFDCIARERKRDRQSKEVAEAAQRQARIAEKTFRQQQIENEKEQWERRECPQCAELVKRKAKICKECSFVFQDWKEQREEMAQWEQRAEVYGLEPWKTEEIIAAEKQTEWENSPEGKAQRLAEEKKREEEEKQRQERLEKCKQEHEILSKKATKAERWMWMSTLIACGFYLIMLSQQEKGEFEPWFFSKTLLAFFPSIFTFIIWIRASGKEQDAFEKYIDALK